MAYNTLSSEHQVDLSGETLLAVVAPLRLPGYVRHELEQHTESVGEILLVEASAPGSAEHPERSLRVLDALMAHAPETDDRQYAAVEKLGFLLEEKDVKADAQAERLLADLTAPGVLREEPALRLAEALVEHGRLEEALICFDVASQRYLNGGVEELNDMILVFASPLHGRARARAKLGYAPDEFDSAVLGLVTSEERLKGLINSATTLPN